MDPIQYECFWRDEPEKKQVEKIIGVFEDHRDEITSLLKSDETNSNDILTAVRSGMERLGFRIESGKHPEDVISLYAPSVGDQPTRFDVDGYHPDWQCVLEVEGGRRDAIYKDIFKGLVLNEASTLVLVVPNEYDYGNETRQSDKRFRRAKREAGSIHATERFSSPCNIVVIGL